LLFYARELVVYLWSLEPAGALKALRGRPALSAEPL
jgi:hypothetical protein